MVARPPVAGEAAALESVATVVVLLLVVLVATALVATALVATALVATAVVLVLGASSVCDDACKRATVSWTHSLTNSVSILIRFSTRKCA